MESPIIPFFEGRGRDSAGRTLQDVLAFSDDELEWHHDFIQWLFPTETRSEFNINAPQATRAVQDAFAKRPELRATLLRGFERLLRFYGFVLDDGGDLVRIRRGPDFAGISERWLRRGNHNLLRISRILESLRILGCPEHAVALVDALMEIDDEMPRRIPRVTMQFWVDRAGY